MKNSSSVNTNFKAYAGKKKAFCLIIMSIQSKTLWSRLHYPRWEEDERMTTTM
jgi:hypothetical protein